jgi:hypothetical protein
MTILAGVAAAILASALAQNSEQTQALTNRRALEAATLGIYQAVDNLEDGMVADLGSAGEPVTSDGLRFWVDIQQDAVDTDIFTLNSVGRAQFVTQALEVVVREQKGGIFHNAVFAGNSSGDPLYSLDFGGFGTQADEVIGNIYSGADVSLSGDAQINGSIIAAGGILGGSGKEGVEQPIPDLAAMNYETTADFDVASLFSGATYIADDAGGTAWQVEESNPAHIFRKNPSDRASAINSTVKDDYFLEDPYETVQSDAAQDGSNPYLLSLSGVGTEPGDSSNNKVFFVDGNVWLHNTKTFSFGIMGGDAGGVQVTFVVKGNVYISDNLFYDDPNNDGIAFIAMKDPLEPDSGNIYLGDPEFGTLQRMYAFLYAEEDFYDVNLDASGSAVVELYGNMTAGDQVLIDRDYVTETGTVHTRLAVEHDTRISDGSLDMPGLPQGSGHEESLFEVMSWRKVDPN